MPSWLIFSHNISLPRNILWAYLPWISSLRPLRCQDSTHDYWGHSLKQSRLDHLIGFNMEMRGANNMVPCREGVISEKTFVISNGGFFPEVNRNTWGSSNKKLTWPGDHENIFKYIPNTLAWSMPSSKHSSLANAQCCMINLSVFLFLLQSWKLNWYLQGELVLSVHHLQVAKPNIVGSKQSSSAKISASAGRNEILQNHRLIALFPDFLGTFCSPNIDQPISRCLNHNDIFDSEFLQSFSNLETSRLSWLNWK